VAAETATGRPLMWITTQYVRNAKPGDVVQLAVDVVAQGRAAMWVRVPGWPIGSPASQAFIADIIPMALGMAVGQGPGGTSLDNTVRIVHAEPTDDWILLDVESEGLSRSVGCGRVRLWRRDGTLIGVGTQSAIIRTSHHPAAEAAQ
jgi:acyl-CoA thioesterase II